MKKNGGVVYSGKVGKNKRHSAAKFRTRQAPVTKHSFPCRSGPFAGYSLALQSDGATLVFIANGVKGRYVGGNWEQQ